MEEILRNSGARGLGAQCGDLRFRASEVQASEFNPCPLTIWETLTVDQKEGISGNFQISLC